MATWTTLSLDSLKAAKGLHGLGHARSATSRAYFATYAAIAGRLPRRMTFAHGRPNPSHANLHDLVRHNVLKSLPLRQQREAARIVRMLRAKRIAADYDRDATVDHATSLESVRDTVKLLHQLEEA